MRYLITESQYNLLIESVPNWIKRRLTTDTLKTYIDEAIQKFPCNDWVEDYVWAQTIINSAIDDFLLSDESMEWGEDYDEVFDLIQDFAEKLFFSELLKLYKEKCQKN